MNPHIIDEMHHHVPQWIALLPTVMMAGGFIVAWLFYIRDTAIPKRLAEQHQPLYP